MPSDSEAVVRRWFAEVWNDAKVETIHELFATNAVAYGLAEGGADDVHGPQEFEKFVEAFRGQIQDFRIDVDDVVADGEKVAARWTARGKYIGTLFGPGKGQKVCVTGMTFAEVVDGQIVKGWNNWDIMGMAQQLGAKPPMATMLLD